MSSELDDTLSADSDDAPSTWTPAALPVGTVFADRYEVEAAIGQGGMGAVYRVRDRKLDEAVALKLLTLKSPRAVERFLREVRLARRVTHPNVARTHDLGEHDGVHFLTMELVRGTALDDLLEERGALPAPRVAEIGAQIAAGLSAAHGAGVVHRDLKPANVLIAEDGRVVLTDFGIARATSAETRTHETGALVGTPHYMAPEQVSGRPVDARADLYALGLILYEMVTGTLPFDGDNAIAVAVQRLHETPEDPRRRASVPDPLAELILRCLAREPDSRPQSAVAIGEALAGRAARPSGYGTAGHRTGSTPSLFAPMIEADQALAVLPFTYRGSPEHDYLGEGLAEELIDVLSRTKGLKVLALGATRRFAEDRDPARIAAELGADAVVDGTVQLSGDRVRLSARLVEDEGVQRWSERFDGRLVDVFELQESMGRRVAEALRLEVDAARYRRTAPREAIELYLRGRRGLMGDVMTQAELSVADLEQALALAPDFAPAKAALAMASVRAWWGQGPDPASNRADRAKANVQRAVDEAPDLAETQVARAMLAVQSGDFREAARASGRALELVPTLAIAHQYLGEIQIEAGRAKEGKERVTLALELDPSLNVAHFVLARLALLEGDLKTHRRNVDALLRATETATISVNVSRFRWALWRRDDADAKAILDTIRGLGVESATQLAKLAEVAFGRSDPAAGLEVMEQVAQWLQNPRFTSLMLQVAAEVYAYAGHREHTLRMLERAGGGILIDILWIRSCPLFEDLSGDPRYEAAVREVDERARAVWRR